MNKSKLYALAAVLSSAATSHAFAAPVVKASIPAVAAATDSANLGGLLHKAHHAKYHYCGYTTDRWGRPYWACWWDKRVVRQRYY